MTKSKRNPNDKFVIRDSSFAISCAFTLIEMLLALAISAIVVAGVGGVFYSALRLRESTTATLDASIPVQHALAIMRRDLLGALPRGSDLIRDFQSGTVSGGVSQNGRLQFYTSTGIMNEKSPWGDLQQVIYELRPGSSGASATQASANELIRSVTRTLLTSTASDVEEQFLLGNVQNLEVSCYDGVAWQPSWDTTMGNTNLPSAVRIRIQLVAEKNADPRNQEPIEMVIPLVSQSRTNQTQSAGGGG